MMSAYIIPLDINRIHKKQNQGYFFIVKKNCLSLIDIIYNDSALLSITSMMMYNIPLVIKL